MVQQKKKSYKTDYQDFREVKMIMEQAYQIEKKTIVDINGYGLV